jgi:sugar O-acyltransferase (sialic acid O-acetyltransferase NeuD family)
MAKLVIFGTGTAAELAYTYFTRDSEHEVVGFTIDDTYRDRDHLSSLPVCSFEEVEQRFPPEDHAFFVAVGYTRMNEIRAERCRDAKAKGYRLESYISSRSHYLSDAPPGENCFVFEGTIVQPYATIGRNVTMWSGSCVCHHSTVEDNVFIAPNATIAGFCRIGHNAFLGANSVVRDSVAVAPYSLVGAGALIKHDTVERGVYRPEATHALDKRSDEIEI